mgnify:CR=1 FL=1
MSDATKVFQAILVLAVVFLIDKFVISMPFWLFVIIAVVSLATLEMYQSEHGIRLFKSKIKNKKT